MKKKVKWTSLLLGSLFFLTACGTGPVTADSSNLWDQVIVGFAKIIQLLSINGNVGIGIILFTILIRTLLLPLFQVQMKSTRKMQDIQPQVKALQEQYAGYGMEGQRELNEAIRKLYKENDVSMLASVWPLLIQLPILMALYHALTVDFLKTGEFLWLHLGKPDPYFVLPVLAAAFTFCSMWLSNKASLEKNPMTTVMSYLMSAMIFWFALTSASGVALYWTVSNAYQVFQTLLLNNPFKIVAARKAAVEAEKERKAKIRRAQKKARKKK